MAKAMFQGGGAERSEAPTPQINKKDEVRLVELHREIGLNAFGVLINLDHVQPFGAVFLDGISGQIIMDTILASRSMTDLPVGVVSSDKENSYRHAEEELVRDFVAENSADPNFLAGINLAQTVAGFVRSVMDMGATENRKDENVTIVGVKGAEITIGEMNRYLRDDARGLSMFQDILEKLQLLCDDTPSDQSKKQGMAFGKALVKKAVAYFTQNYLDELAKLYSGKRFS